MENIIVPTTENKPKETWVKPELEILDVKGNTLNASGTHSDLAIANS